MAEVGVLNLTIKDNSAVAAQGLDNLTDALRRIKNAIRGGYDLSGVAKGIEALGKAVDNSIHGSTIAKLDALAKSLSQMKDMGPIHIHIKDSGVERVRRSVSGIQETAQNTQTGFETVASTIEKVTQKAAESTKEVAKAEEATNKWLEKAIEINHPMKTAYAALPKRSLEDYFTGTYYKRTQDGQNEAYQRQNDLMSSWLHGNGTQNEQLYALGEVAQKFGMTIDDVKAKITDLQTTESPLDNVTGSVDSATVSLEKLKDTEEETRSTTEKLKAAFRNLFDNIGDNPFSKLLKQFARIAKYRILRTVIKKIGEGFKEGLENVYEYSKAVGTSFAPAMDSLKQTMSGFKNSLGAALAPALQALIPLLNSIVNAAIPVINVLNQILALLGGQTSWTSATSTAKAMDNIKASAGGASDSMKEMLASFDELNVIASQSGGGGGGGGGGITDYAGMFGENFAFDPELVKIIDWIKDNLESIKGIAIAIGVAMLGWKFSNAFLETIPWLSKLFGLISTGAAIAITLQLNWLFTNLYLDTKKPGWLFADALTTAVGATAAWALARKLVSARFAKYAAIITLAFSAYTGIKALLGAVDVGALSAESITTAIENALKVGAAAAILYHTVGGASMGLSLAGGAVVAATVFGAVIGLKVALDPNIELFSTEFVIASIISAAVTGLGVAIITGNPVIGAGVAIATFLAYIAIKAYVRNKDITWGTVELSDKQVEEFVNGKMYSIDVKTTTKIIAETIDTTGVKKDEIEAAVVAALGTLEVINLGIDTSDNYETLHAQVDGVVAAIQGFITAAEAQNKLTIQLTPTLVGENETEQSDWLKNNTAGWTAVDDFARSRGEEIGKLIDKGMKGALEEGEPELLNQLMQELADLSSAITKAQIGGEAYAALTLGLGDLTEASFDDVIALFTEYKATLTSQYKALIESQVANQTALVAALLTIDPEAKNEATQKAIADLEDMKANMVSALETSVSEATEPGKNLMLEWIFGKHGIGSVTEFDLSMYEFSALKPENLFKAAGLTAEGLKNQFHLMLMQNGVSKEEIEIMNLIGFSGFDLLSADLQQQLVSWIGVTPETVGLLKDGLGLNADQIIQFSGWDTLSENAKKELQTAIDNAFGTGTNSTATATVDAKSDIDVAVTNESAVGAKNTVTSTIEEGTKSLTVGADSTSKSLMSTAVKDAIETRTKVLTVASSAYSRALMATQIRDSIEAKNKGVNVTVSNASKNDIANEIKRSIESIRPQITATATINVDVNGTLTLSAIINGGSVSGVTVGVSSFHANNAIQMQAYANGGFPKTGELFMANEDGSTEYIGAIGGRPAVANTDQIVTGISNGVRDANAEQNMLLRQQNDLLRAILEKDNSVRIGASVELGRTVRRSLDMYSTVGG